MATALGFPFWRAQSLICRGLAKVREGEIEEGLATIREGVTAYRATGQECWISFFRALEAEAETLRHADVALSILDDGLETSRASGETWFEAELMRHRGELLRDRDPSNAEVLFREALEFARRQHAKLWELRAAVSLARLRRDQGRCDEARDLLTPVYGWFTEGFNTADLKEARGLLEEFT